MFRRAPSRLRKAPSRVGALTCKLPGRYYAAIFLNQLILARKEPEIAHTLLLIYLSLFAARTAKGVPLGSRMLSCILSGIHRAVPFCDVPGTRELTGELLASQLSSLFRCAHAASFATAVQALMVLGHAASFTPAASDRFHRALYSALLHPQLPSSGKQALFLNVCYKAMRSDSQAVRVSAFARRLLQVCAHAPPSFVCGALLLLSEVSKAVPSLKELLFMSEDVGSRVTSAGANCVDSGTAHEVYNCSKRDPLYARASSSQLWEVGHLCTHYHPSVVQFATMVAAGRPIVYAGDPLRDFGLAPFLDKFVFKNPKQPRRSAGGGSIMQPPAPPAYVEALNRRGPVAVLTSKDAQNVAAHERFFHTYFSRRRQVDEHAQKSRAGQLRADARARCEADDGTSVEGASDSEEEFAQKLAESLMQGEDQSSSEAEAEVESERGGTIWREAGFGDSDEWRSDDTHRSDGGELVGSSKLREHKKEVHSSMFADADAFAHILEDAAAYHEGLNPRLALWEEGRVEAKKRRRS